MYYGGTNAGTDGDIHPNCDIHSRTYADGHGDANSNSNCNCNSNADVHANSYTDA